MWCEILAEPVFVDDASSLDVPTISETLLFVVSILPPQVSSFRHDVFAPVPLRCVLLALVAAWLALHLCRVVDLEHYQIINSRFVDLIHQALLGREAI